jgi:transposase
MNKFSKYVGLELHRAGELSAVWIPDEAQEALRDLTRAREDMKHLQRHQPKKGPVKTGP